MVSFAREYIQFAEEMTGPNYGPYMGGDPRHFKPDPDDSTAEQRESGIGRRARPGNEASGSFPLGLASEPLRIGPKTNAASGLGACSTNMAGCLDERG